MELAKEFFRIDKTVRSNTSKVYENLFQNHYPHNLRRGSK